MAQDLGQLTDMWMVNPWMFDPSQKSNQFSQYNNQALPWPPTYNTGAGGPVNAATGQPIQSFQQWQQANPGGMSINSTPAAPAAPQTYGLQPSQLAGPSALNPSGNQAFGMATWGGMMSPQARELYANQQFAPPGSAPGTTYANMGAGGGQQQAGAQQAQASGPPNNWQAAINALANPGRVQTQGANVPQVTGYQPSGGVNQAFLNQAGAGQGMNQNFLNALRSIQARPQ
jgi:hypothetical protein